MDTSPARKPGFFILLSPHTAGDPRFLGAAYPNTRRPSRRKAARGLGLLPARRPGPVGRVYSGFCPALRRRSRIFFLSSGAVLALLRSPSRDSSSALLAGLGFSLNLAKASVYER